MMISARVRVKNMILVLGFYVSVLCVSPLLASDLFQAIPENQYEATFQTDAPPQLGSTRALSNQDPTITRFRRVYVDTDVFDAVGDGSVSELSFNLFDGVNLSGTVTSRVPKGSDTLILSGRIIGFNDSSFSLVRHKGVLIGNIHAGDLGTYQIRYIAKSVYEIRKIDVTQFPPCGTDDKEQLNAVAAVPAAVRQNAVGCDDDGSVIDMLVAYTAQARIGQGGTAAIEALITLSEVETNQAYANSQINNTRINVVLTHEVDYVESGDSGTDRAALSDPFDGKMDEIHDLRRDYAADVVSMIVNSFEVCGRASFSISAGNVPHPEIAFNVVKASCSAGNFTFGHELAHNQGCRHNRERDGSDGGAFLYSHGYREPSGLFRTVMGGGEAGVPRIQHFSNPNVLFNGLPTGLPDGNPASADNAQTIELTSFNVANFRRSNDCNFNGICDDIEIATGAVQDCNNNGFPDECDGDCNGNGLADDCDIASGTSIDCAGDGIPDECESDCNINGVADSCDILFGVSQDINFNGVPDECEPPILYVNQNATGLGLGINWTAAFTNLHQALKVATVANGLVEEIWVAKGIYKPAPPDGDRLATYELAPNVGVYGGFTGAETSRSERNAEVNITTLSGDLNGDDGPDFANTSENTYTIVTSFASESGPATILDGFVISGANAIGAPTSTIFNGGGMSIWNGGPTVLNCLFTANQAYGGSGLYIHSLAHPLITRCRFIGNFGINQGAGISVNGRSTPEIQDCVFLDNHGSTLGAGLAATVDSVVSVTHCTFVDNKGGLTGVSGSISAIGGSKIDLTGCIIWNSTPTNDPVLVANSQDSVITIQHSVISQGASGTAEINGGVIIQGPGNIEVDPLLSPDRIHLLSGSPCIGAGSLDRSPTELDIDGDSRVRNCISDMGADESEFFSDCNTNGQPDDCDIISGMSMDVNQTNVPDECEPKLLVNVANCPNVGTGSVSNPFCDIQTAINSVNPNNSSGTIISLADGIYTGVGNRDLRFGGRSIILSGHNGPAQCILDAEGVVGVFSIDVNDVRLIIIEGLTIKGGNAFSGGGINIDQANVVVSNCLIKDNVATSGGGISTNASYVTISNCTLMNNQATQGGGLSSQDTTLFLEDSFIIQNKANGFSIAEGGGIWLDGGNNTVVGCLIDANIAADQTSGKGVGGGIYLLDNTHRIENCTISRNIAGNPNGTTSTGQLGGGLYLGKSVFATSDVQIDNSIIRENIAQFGGGMYALTATAFINNSTIEDNLAQYEGFTTEGGGARIVNSTILFQNCLIRRNQSVNGRGGGFASVNGRLSLSQCQITANEASSWGGAVYTFSGSSNTNLKFDMAGCTVVGNTSGTDGGGVYFGTSPGAFQKFNLFNTILWGNAGTSATTEDNQVFLACASGCQTDFLHNDIEGWSGAMGGVGNIGADPSFVNAVGLDNVFGTDDDDLHVQGGSPVIDSGDNASVTSGLVADFDGDPRFIDDPIVLDTGNGMAPIVDMGIYEGGLDCNSNGVPDPEDIANGTATDCDSNGVPDSCQLVENDCNNSGIHDACELSGNDCNSSGIPDDCELVSNDCNSSGIPDDCELIGNDCNGSGIPDDCELNNCLLADPACQDCNNNNILDECDIANCLSTDVTCQDCEGNGIPDMCDIINGEPDLDGNGIPDHCSFPPDQLDGELGYTTDRYLSFDPSSNIGQLTAIRVTRVGSLVPWYVSCALQTTGAEGVFSGLVQTAEFCEWTNSVIHVRGCVIVPGNEYLIQATLDDATLSLPLTIRTTPPQTSNSRQFGDVVGSLVGGVWSAPDGLVTVNDVASVVQKFQLRPSAPHLSRVDNDGKTPNGIIASSDILRAVIAFSGGDFGFGVTDCLTGTCVPSCP